MVWDIIPKPYTLNPKPYMEDCQNDGPFLGPCYITAPNI